MLRSFLRENIEDVIRQLEEDDDPEVRQQTLVANAG